MAVRDFKSQRLFVEDALDAGRALHATREQANYLLNVLRLKSGSQLLVFNGKDGEWRCEIEATGRKSCKLLPVAQTRQQPAASGPVYCFAPLKQARLDYMVQKAVEMGVSRLQPVITRHTQVRSINSDRMRANAIEAAEQCGLLNLPEIRDPVPLNALPEALNGALLVICDEQATSAKGLHGLRQDSAAQGLALLIGPEGGFDEEERAFLQGLDNAALLGLGPRILRADTAAVVALAILQSETEDWHAENAK